ncbi:hypothetical protein Scep_014640 [Stephania cephalantha]|uniref:Uncharacterized protein n=1 Tax=Stephania cephalantha TaxID=152367 RepID=A0AAP0J1M5_9MAGN
MVVSVASARADQICHHPPPVHQSPLFCRCDTPLPPLFRRSDLLATVRLTRHRYTAATFPLLPPQNSVRRCRRSDLLAAAAAVHTRPIAASVAAAAPRRRRVTPAAACSPQPVAASPDAANPSPAAAVAA